MIRLTCKRLLVLSFFGFLVSVFSQTLAAQELQKPLRELFVPFEELDVLLGNDTRRVYMTRGEYEDLLEKANIKKNQAAPEKAVLLVANYQIEIGEGRATIHGDLQLDVLADGVQVLVLPFSGVGVRVASLDDTPASLAKNDQGQTLLFVEGIGKHHLTLDLVMPVATDSAQQSLQFQIPTAPTGELTLSVPGNIEIKSGPAVISREVDESSGLTKFKVLPTAAPMSMVMSLNNRKLRDQSTVIARGVVLAEVTEAYERLHATMSMGVLNGAVDEFRFAIDDDLEVNSVSGDLLSRWSIDKVEGKQQLVVSLRNPTSERVVLNIRLDRINRKNDAWSIPKISPIGVAGYSSVVGLLAEERLNVVAIEPESLIAIDSSLLTAALPASLLAAEAGGPQLSAIAAFYAPKSEYSLKSRFIAKLAEFSVGSNTLLTIADRGLEVDGGFTLMPKNEKLFYFEFNCPKTWTINWIRSAEQQPLKFDRLPTPAGDTDQQVRIRVSLPNGVPAGGKQAILFQAQHTPDNWLTKWATLTVQLPNFRVLNAKNQFGAVAASLQDDLQGTPETTEGLLVMNADEKGRFQLSDIDTAVAYRFESAEWKATLTVSRTAPRAVALVHSFFQISPNVLNSHTEITYDVRQARLQEVSFSLPESTPTEVSIRGIGDTIVKETSSNVAEGRRYWKVQLADRKAGSVRLAIDFNQPLNSEKNIEINLPIARGHDIAYQSGAVAIEGHPELEIEMSQNPRAVDIGELVDAEFQVGKRLIGVFGYVGTGDTAIAKVSRRPVHRLPTTIVERAELVTQVSCNGISQTAARFKLRTKAAYIESRLPNNAELWTVLLDGKPTLPQKEQDRVLIALPPNMQVASRDLQLVFESPTGEILLRGQIDIQPPVLYEREDIDAENMLIPIADLKWDLILPSGFRVAYTDGSLTPISPSDTEFNLQRLLGWLWQIGGGHNPPVVLQKRSRFRQTTSAESAAAEYALPQSPAMESLSVVPPTVQSAPEGNLPGPAGGGRRAKTSRDFGSVVPSFGNFDANMNGKAEKDAAAPVDALNASNSIAQDVSRVQKMDERFGAPPSNIPDTAPNSSAAPALTKSWAMEGVRSLSIELDPKSTGQTLSLTSLGFDPQARITIINERRLNWLATAIGVMIFIVGFLVIPARRAARVRYFFSVALLACLIPLASGWNVEMQPISEAAIAGLVALAAILLISSLKKAISARLRDKSNDPQINVISENASNSTSPIVVSLVLLFAGTYSHSSLYAQSPPTSDIASPGRVITSTEELSRIFEALTGSGKVALPPDAVVIPFDATQPSSLKSADKVLLPYEKYVELWNLVNPDKRLTAPSLPAKYAWAAATYSVTLDGKDSLRMSGRLTIEQFTDGEIAIPLALAGCVVESATMDGKPPRLQMVGIEPQQANQQAVQLPANVGPMYILYTQGKGRKEIELQLRWQLEKQSGWRTIAGTLPATPASDLTILVPKPKTEVRLAGLLDRSNFETVKENEKIITTLATDGQFSLNWRDKISEAAIDQGLTVLASSVFDIQEEALKFAWHGQFEFRRGRRESFTLRVPNDYIVEKVVGGNIRGWTVKGTETDQQLDVELLKAVTDRETLIVFLSKQTALDLQANTQISAPQVTVPEAMLHQGHIAIRRSVLLDIRTETINGLTRMDSIDESSWLAAHEITGILPIKLYQTYRYAQVPFDLKLSVKAVRPKVRAQSQTLLKISQLERTLETRLLVEATERSIHYLKISLPQEWKLETPEAPGSFQWSLTPNGDRQIIEMYLANGQSSEFAIILRGKISSETQASVPIALPQIEVVGAERQSGVIVVQADPAYDVRAENLQGCEPGLLDSARSWLADKQRSAARALVRFEGPQYSGQLVVSVRTPIVSGYSVTNVKVTDRAIEETLFIEANIRSAGIKEFTFLMPASMAGAKIQAPHVRQKNILPVTEPANMLRVQLLLQDEIMGQFRVVVEHDRELTSGPHVAALPTIETGSTERRLVTLENVGRDELVTAQVAFFEPLDRSQLKQWIQADLLGGRSSQAYLAQEGGTPQLTYSTKTRSVLTTAGARIGLAQTLLVVDELGAYRATQEYRVENRTEPFLEIELPEGALMWTVQVAGEAVKPTMATNNTNASTRRVRIPLIKTAEGDLDYPVVIKYGGKLATPSWFNRIAFPLIHTSNINVELSQVRLRLPETFEWFNFDGTLGRVQSESDLQAGWLSYRTRQLTELSELLGDKVGAANDYTKARALSNLSTLEKTIQQGNKFFSQGEAASEDFLKELSTNSAALQSVQRQAIEIQQGQTAAERGNRDVLNDLYGAQSNGRSFNSLGDLGLNFIAPSKGMEQDLAKAEAASQQSAWLAQNKLDVQPDGMASRVQLESKIAASKPQAPREEVELTVPLQRSAGIEPSADKRKQSAPQMDLEQDSKATRYGKRLQQQNSMQSMNEALGGISQSGGRTSSPSEPTIAGMGGFGAGGMGGPGGQPASSGQQPTSDAINKGLSLAQNDINLSQPTGGQSVTPAFLASLDVDLPIRGREYFFTTPRGEVELSAQSVASRVYQRLLNIVYLLIVAGAAWLVYLLSLRLAQSRWGSNLLTVVLLLTGILSLALGYLPIFGAIAVLAAVALNFRRFELTAPQTTPT